jgi:hypothetical protein
LPVAGKIDKADGLVVEHPQEAGRPAAVLNIGLSFRADGSEKNARLRLNERSEIGGDLGRPGASFLHATICLAGALSGLHRLDRGREGNVT